MSAIEPQRIIVGEIVGNRALTLEEGAALHDRILPFMKHKAKVVLDFKGVEDVATAFLNTAIGRLYEEFTSEELSAFLDVENLNMGGQRSLEKVLKYAKRFYNVPNAKEA